MTASTVVAGSVSAGVLSTAGPIDTDGQPEWWKCSLCDPAVRVSPRMMDRRLPGLCDTPDGPFPFDVWVWEDEGVPCCFPGYEHDGECGPAGAIVGRVTVTGPSHRGGTYCALHPCGRGDLVGWHTPVGDVTPVDPPIPCDRPRLTGGHLTAFSSRPPAVQWQAPDHVTAALAEVTS